jgi:uncharacterized damage-inducible protein DinB
MTIDSYRRLFAYDKWGNLATLDSIRLATLAPSSRACAVLAHLIGAGNIWLDRVHGRAATLEVWPTLSLDQCAAGFAELDAGWSAFIEKLKTADVERKIKYVNSKGERWESTIGDILMHVALHGTYHRGQIAMLIRESGNPPAYTDFIEATRRGVVT